MADEQPNVLTENTGQEANGSADQETTNAQNGEEQTTQGEDRVGNEENVTADVQEHGAEQAPAKEPADTEDAGGRHIEMF